MLYFETLGVDCEKINLKNPFNLIAYRVIINLLFKGTQESDSKKSEEEETETPISFIQKLKKERMERLGVDEDEKSESNTSNDMALLLSLISSDIKQPIAEVLDLNSTMISSLMNAIKQRADEKDSNKNTGKGKKVKKMSVDDLNTTQL